MLACLSAGYFERTKDGVEFTRLESLINLYD